MWVRHSNVTWTTDNTRHMMHDRVSATFKYDVAWPTISCFWTTDNIRHTWSTLVSATLKYDAIVLITKSYWQSDHQSNSGLTNWSIVALSDFDPFLWIANYELLRWLVEMPSCDICHYRMRNVSAVDSVILQISHCDVTMHHCKLS